MANLSIKRHKKIKGGFNPDDPAWEPYLEERREQRLPDYLQSHKRAKLYLKQEGRCPYCGGKLDGEWDDCGWDALNVHHRIPLSKGGKDTQKNKVLLHDVCHRQLHALHEDEVLPAVA